MGSILRVRDDAGNVIDIPAIQGPPGVGVESFERTAGDGSPGTDDTYTLALTDGKTYAFTVHNGKDSGADEAAVRSIAGALVSAHNTDANAHSDIRSAVAAAQSTAEGKASMSEVNAAITTAIGTAIGGSY